ncbi:hypothetical protein W97_01934 [Coniosporium apollinis CBS 100218]|uniref:Dol-P-Glc:Glc(2)Man(9)GlcNAc(2)-PP-Dol alpha-1,2-glucosyltransferase n=1 Tax=Coniosporium apollinis (strain CBS 100218) TaxID=1168221 RepID=R7YLC9_CONA1|nr:uncharacterized protein W97_01934 [Coniosporium apollinis CBS 100218]EON62710.1 hypothetical protein W97_01934 [Coniosporium apollinis CBS 100218]
MPAIIAQLAFTVLRTGKGIPSGRGGAELGLLGDGKQSTIRAIVSAITISLFPPLFFFSALFYTDVVSTWLVLMSYQCMLVLGAVSLSFRQTNIFWVAVLPAGLSVIRELKKAAQTLRRDNGQIPRAFLEVVRDSWEASGVYDIAVEDASFEDYVKVVMSISIAAVKNISKVTTAIVPYLLLLVSFAGFVAWNGGVVLGDKSNHVATIHLPQMLYLWPYITFFSFPLLLPHILAPLVSLFQPRRTDSTGKSLFSLTPAAFLPRTWVFLTLTALAMATAHFNTIIHPFTLADNRHYVFYVFRILLRHPAIKYLAAPIYVFCGWTCVRALGAPPDLTVLGADAQAVSKPRPAARQPREARAKTPGCDVSFVIVWSATCTLSLVTAPLVEPRYFILPWLMWRLHVPIAGGYSDSTPPAEPAPASEKRLKQESLKPPEEQSRWPVIIRILRALQINAVWLELAWFLVVNAVTGYVFLYKGFEWPQEPGQVQRFMW